MIGPPPLVPSWYKIPMRVETPDFVLVPLRMDRFYLDFEAYMSSIGHLQKTLRPSTDRRWRSAVNAGRRTPTPNSRSSMPPGASLSGST